MAPDNLVSALDRAFENRPTELARRPGRLTTMINSLPACERNKPACPRLVIAVLTSRTVQRADLTTERPAAETAMLAHWDGCFHNNNHQLVTANGFNPSLKDIEELGEKTVQVLRRNDLICQGDSVIDVGTGKGFIAKHLALQGVKVEAIEPGVKVEAIEPGVVLEGEQTVFPGR